MPQAKADLSHIGPRCPVVQAWMRRGWFDIDELKAHVASCDACQGIQGQVDAALRQALDDMSADDQSQR